jgi:hypothetical protein
VLFLEDLEMSWEATEVRWSFWVVELLAKMNHGILLRFFQRLGQTQRRDWRETIDLHLPSDVFHHFCGFLVLLWMEADAGDLIVRAFYHHINGR